MDALFTATVERFGRVDLLFNNAGINGPREVPVEELSYEDWRNVVDVDLGGAFLCAQAAYRRMKEQDPLPRRPDHRQRFRLGAHAPPALGRLHSDQRTSATRPPA